MSQTAVIDSQGERPVAGDYTAVTQCENSITPKIIQSLYLYLTRKVVFEKNKLVARKNQLNQLNGSVGFRFQPLDPPPPPKVGVWSKFFGVKKVTDPPVDDFALEYSNTGETVTKITLRLFESTPEGLDQLRSLAALIRQNVKFADLNIVVSA